MEQKNRWFITFSIIGLIFIAILGSFGRSLFFLNTPEVVLPESDSPASSDAASQPVQDSGQYQPVTVTPKTVQNVIATLSRTDSYSRDITLETFWSGGSSASTVQVWTDGGWTHSIQALPSGVVRHDLVGNDMVYYWYEGSQSWESAPADDRSADLAQRLPTYETVLQLDTDSISAAGYELREGVPCVYAEILLNDLSLSQRYWVSTDTGLLVAAETWHGEQLLYRMTALSPITTPCPSFASFSLPDGTVLYSMP